MSNSNKMIKSIRDKWYEGTKINGGYFVRFLDGNTLNCCRNNLQLVTPVDAFNNITKWKVDWDCDLTNKEIVFVFNNLQKFISIYS